MGNKEYLEKWLNGTLSGHERILFEQTREYRSLEKLSKALTSFKAPEYDVQKEFQRLQSRKTSGERAKVVAMPWLKPLLRIAAILVLAGGGYFIFLLNLTTTIDTLSAEKTKIFLPDSSEVTLNTFSKISYRASSWGRRRSVTLDGEAFFKVAKGSQFDVETNDGTVTVLGTRFNVKRRKNYFEVVCYEGLVEVKSAGKVIKLPPFKMFRIVKGAIAPYDYTTEVSPGWLLNESSFESVPFSEVIEEFERQYNVTVSTKNVNLDKLFTGRFTNSDFIMALESISIPLNLKYKVTGDQKTVVLSGEVK